jgi:hypothetical protein
LELVVATQAVVEIVEKRVYVPPLLYVRSETR